jgi:hypothetical protein
VKKGTLTDAKYGEQQAFQQQQSQAPMGAPVDTAGIIPLSAPTQHPDQPITAGSDLGAGPSSAVLGRNPQAAAMDEQTRARLKAWLPVLMFQASQPDASDETRQFVRQLRGEM